MIRRLKSTTTFRTGQRKTKTIRHFLRKFLNDWSMEFSAMLAYNLLIAMLPIAVALFGISGLILRNYPDLEEKIKEKVTDLFPSDNATQSGIAQIVNLAFNQLSRDAGFILTLGIIFALFGASRLFIAIDKCLTIVYRLPERSWLHQNVLAVLMIFVFILILPILLIASSAPSALMNILPGGSGYFGTFFGGVTFSCIVAFILFELVYWVIPNKKMSFKVTWCGSLIAALTLQIFILLFPFYIGRFMRNYAGQIGFAVILLLFFYYFAIILIFGAQINAFFFEKYQPFSNGLGSYINHLYGDHPFGNAQRLLDACETDDEPEQQSTINEATDR